MGDEGWVDRVVDPQEALGAGGWHNDHHRAGARCGLGGQRFSGADRSDALFLLTIMAGALMVAAGLLRLGRYTRFVSVSVLTGFLTGVAFNIIFGQLGDLLGAPPTAR